MALLLSLPFLMLQLELLPSSSLSLLFAIVDIFYDHNIWHEQFAFPALLLMDWLLARFMDFIFVHVNVKYNFMFGLCGWRMVVAMRFHFMPPQHGMVVCRPPFDGQWSWCARELGWMWMRIGCCCDGGTGSGMPDRTNLPTDWMICMLHVWPANKYVSFFCASCTPSYLSGGGGDGGQDM